MCYKCLSVPCGATCETQSTSGSDYLTCKGCVVSTRRCKSCTSHRAGLGEDLARQAIVDRISASSLQGVPVDRTHNQLVTLDSTCMETIPHSPMTQGKREDWSEVIVLPTEEAVDCLRTLLGLLQKMNPKHKFVNVLEKLVLFPNIEKKLSADQPLVRAQRTGINHARALMPSDVWFADPSLLRLGSSTRSHPIKPGLIVAALILSLQDGNSHVAEAKLNRINTVKPGMWILWKHDLTWKCKATVEYLSIILSPKKKIVKDPFLFAKPKKRTKIIAVDDSDDDQKVKAKKARPTTKVC